MKVRNTLVYDLLFQTRAAKAANLVPGINPSRYDVHDALRYIVATYPSRQYNGVAQFPDILTWCEQQFGNDYYWNFETIYFKSINEKALFLLRWA